MYWINGVPKDTIPTTDRSFNYGDGGFTTIKTVAGRPVHWSYHVERMQACLELLHIAQPDWQQVSLWVENAAIKSGVAGIKLHVSRGSGGRGYSPTGADSTLVTISHFSYPTHYLCWQESGIELGVASLKLGLNPALAGHKHNNRLEQVLLKAEAEQQGFQDVIALDLNEQVIETTMANLFWVKEGNLYTPSLKECGVAGVARRWIIEQAEKSGFKVTVGAFILDHLLEADEVFICNSLLDIAPIVKIKHKLFAVGITTRDFQKRLNSA
ncbi:aminodeoxychorismate lyase [Vibrio sp. UCD-FRSSP16_10]|uniref:aminodeoxychorismate lyase n=1 Tax=unclassified Vibrio TaxID=2614977 RepID=UPI000800C102|nr:MULTISPECIES: aminodeoxychorismate lyase [unclassified Vibrio]OBT08515.1 aminodeoxychorismate lyase [Vibrio sp. UCD-FRSSP16_30]OBT18045.1 aminodeoxychorismate lyase [Vibrio sp. UCD-FRSSP16_10]